MARRRKMTYLPGQLTLFDIMAGHIENIRAENIQADLEAASGNAGQFTITATEKPESVAVQEDAPPYARLGLNDKGMTVYELKGGERMISRNPEIMQTVDGDKDTPESLFRKEKLQYLTVEEVAKFTKGNTLEGLSQVDHFWTPIWRKLDHFCTPINIQGLPG